MFDASDKQSLDSILKWKQSLDSAVRLIDNKPIPTVLVANKVSCLFSSNFLKTISRFPLELAAFRT